MPAAVLTPKEVKSPSLQAIAERIVRRCVAFGPETWVGAKPPPRSSSHGRDGTRYALAQWEPIGVAWAAERVKVKDLD